MNQLDVDLKPRIKGSKNANRRLRRTGELPAVIYGGDRGAQPVSLDSVRFVKLLPKIRSTTIFNLSVEGESDPQQAFIREIQRHPLYDDHLIHIDFYRIEAGKPVVVEVPVHGIGGVPEGVKMGGVLETLTRRITVKCLPLQVPDSLEIDLSSLEMGQSLHVSDLTTPEGLEVLTSALAALFIISAPRAEEEEVKPAEEEVEGEGEGEGEGEAVKPEGEAEGEEKKPANT